MKIHATKREVFGKKVKYLRNEGMVPGSVFGPKFTSSSITLNGKEMAKIYKDAGFTKFIDLEIEGEKKPQKVLIKTINIHPLKDRIEEVSFYAIDEDRKITVDVPVHILGESPAVKQNLGFMMQQMNTLSLHCLPKDLPQYVEVDISNLEKPGDSITVAHVKLPENVDLDSSMEATSAVIYISAPQKEEVEEAPVAAAEGEAPAEGAAAPVEGAAKAE